MSEIYQYKIFILTRDDICNYVFGRRTSIDTISPLSDYNDISTFLARIWWFPCFVDESTTVQSRHLTSSYVWAFEIRVKQQVKTKRNLWIPIVHCDIQV